MNRTVYASRFTSTYDYKEDGTYTGTYKDPDQQKICVTEYSQHGQPQKTVFSDGGILLYSFENGSPVARSAGNETTSFHPAYILYDSGYNPVLFNMCNGDVLSIEWHKDKTYNEVRIDSNKDQVIIYDMKYNPYEFLAPNGIADYHVPTKESLESAKPEQKPAQETPV